LLTESRSHVNITNIEDKLSNMKKAYKYRSD